MPGGSLPWLVTGPGTVIWLSTTEVTVTVHVELPITNDSIARSQTRKSHPGLFCHFRLSIGVLVVPHWLKWWFRGLFFHLINTAAIFLRPCAEYLGSIEYILNILYFIRIHEVLNEPWRKCFSNTIFACFPKRQLGGLGQSFLKTAINIYCMILRTILFSGKILQLESGFRDYNK